MTQDQVDRINLAVYEHNLDVQKKHETNRNAADAFLAVGYLIFWLSITFVHQLLDWPDFWAALLFTIAAHIYLRNRTPKEVSK